MTWAALQHSHFVTFGSIRALVRPASDGSWIWDVWQPGAGAESGLNDTMHDAKQAAERQAHQMIARQDGF